MRITVGGTRRFTPLLGAMVVASVLAFPAGAGSTVSAATVLAGPSGLRVTPGVGTVTLSWTGPTSAGVTYTVTSTPAGKGCTVAGALSCVIPVTDSTPWQFSVVASESVGAGVVDSPSSALTPPLRHRDVVIVAGQSNATGWLSYRVNPTTGVNYFSPARTDGADATDTITWMPFKSVLPPPGTTPVPLDTPQYVGTTPSDPSAVFGPEIGLARQIYTDTGTSLTVVKVADPGTSLISDWNPDNTGGCYPAMLAEVRSVMEGDAGRGQFDLLSGFYWYQGERDARSLSSADTYQANLTGFIDHLRSDLPMSTIAPIALVKEGRGQAIAQELVDGSIDLATATSEVAANQEVRAADDWAAANLPHVVEVDSAGLPRGSDHLHLTDASELAVGHMLAAATEHLMP